MQNTLATLNTAQNVKPRMHPMQRQAQARPQAARSSQDTVSIGGNTLITAKMSIKIVVERSMARIRLVVSNSAEAAGVQGNGQVSAHDQSAEAVAGRIADFALGAFEAWWDNHDELGEDEARQQFVDFIGGAIGQGIAEARDILGALNALTPGVDSKISSISEMIQARLDEFAANGAQQVE